MKDLLNFMEENPILTFILACIIFSTIGEIGVAAFNAIGSHTP